MVSSILKLSDIGGFVSLSITTTCFDPP